MAPLYVKSDVYRECDDEDGNGVFNQKRYLCTRTIMQLVLYIFLRVKFKKYRVKIHKDEERALVFLLR